MSIDFYCTCILWLFLLFSNSAPLFECSAKHDNKNQQSHHKDRTRLKYDERFYHPIDNNETLFILPIPDDSFELSKEWSLEMPKKSYFAGFKPPNDAKRWKIACLQAQRGEQILLQQVFKVVGSSKELLNNQRNFKGKLCIILYIFRLAYSQQGLLSLFSTGSVIEWLIFKLQCKVWI